MTIITALRREAQMARVRLDILSNAFDRRRRRNLAARFDRSAEPTTGLQAALAKDGCVPWEISQASLRSLSDAWNSIATAGPSGERVERSSGKAFFKETLSSADLKNHPAFVSVALEESLLRTIMGDLGMVPHLESVEVIVSSPTGGGLSASQLWHRDVNDSRLLKLFVYLNDVGDEQGPFTYIPASVSRTVPAIRKHYLSDEFISRFAPCDSWRTVKGERGTAFLVDTGRCFHCGSRNTQPRVAYIATYSCGIKYMKYSERWSEILNERRQQLSPLQLAVCDLE